MGGMMKKVQEMQTKMQEMQKELENKTVEAESGGGWCRAGSAPRRRQMPWSPAHRWRPTPAHCWCVRARHTP